VEIFGEEYSRSDLEKISTKHADEYMKKSDQVSELQEKIDQMTMVIRQLASEIEVLKKQLEELQASNVSNALDMLDSISGKVDDQLYKEAETEITKLQEVMKIQSDLVSSIENDIDAEIQFWRNNLIGKTEL